MSKVEPLTSINASYTGITKLNSHLDKIEAAFQNTLSRDGSTPNSMQANLDMNSNRIINVLEPTASGDVATKSYVDNLVNAITGLATPIAHTWAKLVDGTLTLQNYAAFQALTGHSSNVTYKILGRTTAGDGGGGTFRWNSSNLSSSVTNDPGKGMYLPPNSNLTGSSGAGERVLYDNVINVQWFGIFPSAADNSTSNGHLQTWINAQTVAPHIYYPPGNYSATTPVTFSKSRLKIECAPGVTFTSLGSNPALVLDGGAAGFMVGAALLGWPRCRTHATSGTHAVYIRSYHHGVLQFVVDGAGTSSPGFLLEFGVCPHFQNVQVCKNETNDQWYNSGTGAAIPLYSGKVTRRANGDESGYPMFTDPVFEDGVNGLYCDYQVGTQVFGGTMENFSGIGYIDTANSRHTKFYGTDFEANATRDLDIYGYANEFHGIDSELEIKFRSGADRNIIMGGAFKNVVVDSGALNTIGHGFVYDRFSNGGNITDSGTRSSWHGIFKRDATTPLFRSGDRTESTVVPGGTEYFYTNTTGNNIRVRKIGGTETFVGINGNSSGAATGQFLLAPGDLFSISGITVAPTLKISGC